MLHNVHIILKMANSIFSKRPFDKKGDQFPNGPLWLKRSLKSNVSSKGTGESAHLRRHARVFVAQKRDNYQKLVLAQIIRATNCILAF